MRRGYKRMNNLTTDTYISSMTLLPTLSAVGSKHTGATLICGLLEERELVLSIHFRTIFR